MDYYEELVKLYQEYPELTFQNKGYQYLPKEVKERNQEGIDKISVIIKKPIPGFVRFDNFKHSNKNGEIYVRCQYNYGYNSSERGSHFTGVGYFPLKDFKDMLCQKN